MWDDFDRSFHEKGAITLRTRGIKIDDVANWGWILSGDGPDDIAHRFLSTTSERPTFLLLEILRRDISKVRTLKMMLVYVWDHILGKSTSSITNMSEHEIDAITTRPEVAEFSYDHMESAFAPGGMGNAFIVMISRLLRQTRRIWPSAMVSVSHMVGPYIHAVLATKSGSDGALDDGTFARLCKLHNYVLRMLALPSSIDPLKSMVHNWNAQKVLLELAENVDPPLQLDQNSYRAVIQVLAASRKTDRESKVATLRTRSWPPWRVDQDGMDAQRSPEDDLSRVVLAIMRMKESGYGGNSLDEAMRIIGGQEPDGTPTIHTRKLIKRRSEVPSALSIHQVDEHPDPAPWVARIEATRDIQEAWGAFEMFQGKGGKPNLAIYFAMFQKANYESARSERYTLSLGGTSPGDGKEVLLASNDNISDFYRLRLQAPGLEDLYAQMIQSGLRPAGRCLIFLLSHARTPDQGIRYLRDSGLENQAVAYLAGGPDTQIAPSILGKVSDSVFAAFVSMICRFAPRAVLAKDDANSDPQASEEHIDGGPQETSKTATVPNNAESVSNVWTIVEMQMERSSYTRLHNPLHHAAFLLKQKRSTFRPAWYALFRALARPGIVISRNLVGDPKNDHLAWQVLMAALNDFHKYRLELDPWGFQIICQGFEKFARSAINNLDMKRAAIEGSQLLKSEFLKISESEVADNEIPKLLHSVGGSHLHAYVRALGVVEDHAGIISVLEWMTHNHEELQTVAMQARNGTKLLKRTVIAMRAFCSGTHYEAKAKGLAKTIDWWDGWPQDSEVQLYLEHGPGNTVNDEEDETEDGEDDHGSRFSTASG